MKELKVAGKFVLQVFLRTACRFNPFCKPVIPAQLTMYLLAALFTFLWLRDMILCTFIVEYREIALSAWGFLLMMNFLESLLEVSREKDEEEYNS